MNRQLGIDLSLTALRAYSVGEDGVGKALEVLYRPRCCKHSQEYDSADCWTDAMAFRAHTFGERFEINDVEKVVEYLSVNKAEERLIEAYREKCAKQMERMGNVQIMGTIADHATPGERDRVLRGLGAGAKLLWRSVAAALYWLKANRTRGEDLCGKKLVVLDLDGERPEVTPFDLEVYKGGQVDEEGERIVPVRKRPERRRILRVTNFDRNCYLGVLGGLDEAEQLMEGQFAADVQQAIERGDNGYEAWIREDGAWRKEQVEFAAEGSEDVIRELFKPRNLFAGLDGERVIVLCVGWYARRYARQFEEEIKAKLGCGEVEVLGAEAICAGAAEFGRRLGQGLPTYYDELPRYQWWDGKKAEWKELFKKYLRIEPGMKCRFPAEGEEPCVLSIAGFNDNVSMYIQVATEDGKYEGDEEFAHRLKINFAEFIREKVKVQLTAEIDPTAGSAKFTLTAEKDLFLDGKHRTKSATLSYSEDPDLKNDAVKVVKEHEGYLEAQPVLGRIYDSPENLEMVELKVKKVRDPGDRDRYLKLKEAYLRRYGESGKTILDRVGYHANPREPTRGMFGTKRIPDSRINSASVSLANQACANFNGAERLCNYCHGRATDKYKQMIRRLLKDGVIPEGFNFYYAPGYVLASADDFKLVMNYFLVNSLGSIGRYAKIFWSIFRMLCWHDDLHISAETVDVRKFFERCLEVCEMQLPGNARDVADFKTYLLLAILYILRIREEGDDLDNKTQTLAESLIQNHLSGVRFPKTMINNLNGTQQKAGDTLSEYVLRFVRKEDTLKDRELGAAMGGV
jgi:hypothetical protein